MSKLIIGLIIGIFVLGFIVVPIFVYWLVNRFELPEIPAQYDESDVVYCDCRCLSFSFYSGVLFLIGSIFLCVCISLILDNAANIGLAMMFMPAICYAGMIAIILFMKNQVVIFLPNGIIYKNFIGKLYIFDDSSIIGYVEINSSGAKSIKLRTNVAVNISINSYCSDFEEACEFVKKYPSLGRGII